MAPMRLSSKPFGVNENLNGIAINGIATRSKQLTSMKGLKDNLKVPIKRKADSPLKDLTAKRAAFGDITNAVNKSYAAHDKEKVMVVKKIIVEKKVPCVKTTKQPTIANEKASKIKQTDKTATNAIDIAKHYVKELPKPAIVTRAQNGILKKTKINHKENQNSSNKSRRSDSSDPSLYVTALENSSPGDTKEDYKSISEKFKEVVLEDTLENVFIDEVQSPHKLPKGIADFDMENWNDPLQVSCYAKDIFNYLRNRERLFVIDNYLPRLNGITSWMRALLVDWMVEVQESFELNHETLYLGVKLVDLFLTRSTKKNPPGQTLTKEELQLLGAASLFIASKFDERIPPQVDDFLYICDGAYTLSQLLKMEINIVRVIDFDLGIPISYRFLRRYARCARVSMPTLTLARYVLELCLLDYSLMAHSDSKMAAAALYIALRMKSLSHWTPTLQYYTGYTLEEIMPIVLQQNATLHKKPKSAISTVRNKYSHSIFFEVAKLPLLDDAALSS